MRSWMALGPLKGEGSMTAPHPLPSTHAPRAFVLLAATAKTVAIEATLRVLIPLIDEFVREAVTDAYAEKSSD